MKYPNYAPSQKNYCNACERAYAGDEASHVCGSSGPAPDAMLTAEERAYLQESLGLTEPIQLDLDDSTAPYCHSCIKHGDDRVGYPCARDLADCGWRKKQEALTKMSVPYTTRYATNTTSVNYGTSTWINSSARF